MKMSEALAEAKRRWGPTAYICMRRAENYRFEVGAIPSQSGTRGYSNESWEDAFASVDLREGKNAD